MRRRLQRHWKRSLASVALLLALGASPALAAILKVSGSCTLINAINAANNVGPIGGCINGSAGADTIFLPPNSTQVLRAVNHSALYGPTGLPTIRSAITINGNGSTIRRAPNAPDFRILVVGETGSLRVLNTTVTGGRAVDVGGSTPYGDAGGGIYVNGGFLTLIHTTLSGNSAAGWPGGGGILAINSAGAVISSTISDNAAGFGGGIVCDTCNITFDHSIIFGNTGGGVAALDNRHLEVITSTVSNNKGNGISEVAPEGGSPIIVTRSTISGNSEAGLFGGQSGSFEVTNSTISGNGQGIAGGTGEGLGLALTHSTVTRNRRGGVYVNAGSSSTQITFALSLISGNGGREVYIEQSEYSTPLVTANNFNVFGHSGDARVTGFTPGPIDIVPSQLLDAIFNLELTNTGGPTKTHALVPGSPAIDAVNDGNFGCSLSRDQRSVRRPQDGDRDGVAVCDVGAVEHEAPPLESPAGALPNEGITAPEVKSYLMLAR